MPGSFSGPIRPVLARIHDPSPNPVLLQIVTTQQTYPGRRHCTPVLQTRSPTNATKTINHPGHLPARRRPTLPTSIRFPFKFTVHADLAQWPSRGFCTAWTRFEPHTSAFLPTNQQPARQKGQFTGKTLLCRPPPPVWITTCFFFLPNSKSFTFPRFRHSFPPVSHRHIHQVPADSSARIAPQFDTDIRLRSYQTQSAVSHSELRSQVVLGRLSTGEGDQPGTAW